MSSEISSATLEALGLAASAVAHDFDNALMAIINHAALIRARSRDPELTAHAEAILRAARGAGRVVERVRGLVRPGEAHPQEQLDLGTLIAEALDLATTRAGRAGIELRVLEQAGPLTTTGDAAELVQALTNIIHNAIDAAQMTVTIAVTSDGVITIEDDGPGIPASLGARIFEPYFTTRDNGTGLGLPSAHQTITQHLGTLELLAANPGTIARVTLPIIAPGSNLPTPRPITDLDLSTTQLDARVLIIDDSRDTRDALEILFQAAGFKTLLADSEATALTRFHADRPELVVTDLRLGDQLAYGLIDRLAALRPGIPIIVVTGLTLPERPPRLKRMAAAIFEKPFSPARLLETARRLVAERQALAHMRRPQ